MKGKEMKEKRNEEKGREEKERNEKEWDRMNKLERMGEDIGNSYRESVWWNEGKTEDKVKLWEDKEKIYRHFNFIVY